MTVKKSQTGRHGHRGTEIPSHGINSDPDHGETGAINKGVCNKTKARRISAGPFLEA
jgi:hypothetical protein